jgi:anti-sigma B factor antagonist
VTSAETLTFAVDDGPANALIVTAHGIIGLAGAGRLEAALTGFARHGRSRIVIDMADVTLIDSAGLTGLLRVHREAARRGGWVRLVRIGSRVRRVVETLNLGRVLTIHDSVDQASR